MVKSGPIESAPEGERRLAAIVFSDVVDYSARMQRDETGTMPLVGADFARMAALAADEGGEVLNTMGDGMLLAFPTAVQAVTFGLQAQAEFAHRRVLNPPEKALEHRIGIHVGDVFRLGDRVAGDGVNIASRLQARAPAGGICVSQTVYDLIKGKVTVESVALGPQEFKNIAEKIPIYHLVLPVGGGPPRTRKPRMGLAVAVGVVILAAIGGWSLRNRIGGSAPASPQVDAVSVQPTGAAPEGTAPMNKSIAVLPFVNMSDSKENAYFADGVQEDILTSLANIGDLRVVSRTSVIQYRDSAKPIRQIGAELGVAFVLEGSVQRAGNRVLVTGQLINARTDEHVWAKSYDRELDDIFAIQAELAKAIATGLQAVLSPREEARLASAPTTNTGAYDLYLKAREVAFSSARNLENLSRAEPLLERAVELDPKFSAAFGALSDVESAIYFRVDDIGDVHRNKAVRAFESMERLAPDDPNSWLEAARYYLRPFAQDYARADGFLHRAAEALPNNGDVALLLAESDRLHGRWSEALAHFRQAYALDRQGPGIRIGLFQWLITTRRYGEATALAKENSQSEGTLLAQVAFYERGSTKEMNDWIAAHPVAVGEQLWDWYEISGNAEGLVRLLEEGRRNVPGSLYTSLQEAQYALALTALGRTDEARKAATENLTQFKAAAGFSNVLNLAALGRYRYDIYLFNLAALGRYRDAIKIMDDGRAKDLKDGIETDYFDYIGERVYALAALGEREKALAELARLLKIPCGLNVNRFRRAFQYRALVGDPAFEAVLNDPANNAPLL